MVRSSNRCGSHPEAHTAGAHSIFRRGPPTPGVHRLQAQLSGLFFKPVQFHRQLTHLLLQPGHFTFGGLGLGRGSVLKHFGQAIHDRPLPLADLRRLHLILPRNLRHRLDSRQCFQSHFGLEGRLMSLSFCFHLVVCFSTARAGGCPSDTKKSYLATGPNFGDKLRSHRVCLNKEKSAPKIGFGFLRKRLICWNCFFQW